MATYETNPYTAGYTAAYNGIYRTLYDDAHQRECGVSVHGGRNCRPCGLIKQVWKS